MIPIIRYGIVFVAAIIPLIIVFRKYIKNNNQKKYIVIYLALLSVVFSIARFPIENLFLKYDSPEEAYHYTERGEYLGTEEGENSYLIISQHKSEQKNIYLSKEKNYLKMPFSPPKEKLVSFGHDPNIIASFIREEDSNNGFIVLILTYSSINDKENYITDNMNSEFKRHLYSDERKNDYFHIYSAYVENLDENNYVINIDGEEYEVFLKSFHTLKTHYASA